MFHKERMLTDEDHYKKVESYLAELYVHINNKNTSQIIKLSGFANERLRFIKNQTDQYHREWVLIKLAEAYYYYCDSVARNYNLFGASVMFMRAEYDRIQSPDDRFKREVITQLNRLAELDMVNQSFTRKICEFLHFSIEINHTLTQREDYDQELLLRTHINLGKMIEDDDEDKACLHLQEGIRLLDAGLQAPLLEMKCCIALSDIRLDLQLYNRALVAFERIPQKDDECYNLAAYVYWRMATIANQNNMHPAILFNLKMGLRMVAEIKVFTNYQFTFLLEPFKTLVCQAFYPHEELYRCLDLVVKFFESFNRTSEAQKNVYQKYITYILERAAWQDVVVIVDILKSTTKMILNALSSKYLQSPMPEHDWALSIASELSNCAAFTMHQQLEHSQTLVVAMAARIQRLEKEVKRLRNESLPIEEQSTEIDSPKMRKLG